MSDHFHVTTFGYYRSLLTGPPSPHPPSPRPSFPASYSLHSSWRILLEAGVKSHQSLLTALAWFPFHSGSEPRSLRSPGGLGSCPAPSLSSSPAVPPFAHLVPASLASASFFQGSFHLRDFTLAVLSPETPKHIPPRYVAPSLSSVRFLLNWHLLRGCLDHST